MNSMRDEADSVHELVGVLIRVQLPPYLRRH
jgi:hypothetical protein